MRRCLAALALAGMTLSGREQARENRAKPEPPVTLEAALEGGPPGPFVVTARASSPIDAEVAVEIVLPDGMALISGTSSSKGRRPEIRAELAPQLDIPPELYVRASLRRGSARITQVVPLKLRGEQAPRPGVLMKNSRGEAIREFGP